MNQSRIKWSKLFLSHEIKCPGLTCVCVCVCVLSQAVVADRTMYISGQLGMDVASGQLVDGGVKAQTKQVMMLTMISYQLNHFIIIYKEAVSVKVTSWSLFVH